MITLDPLNTSHHPKLLCGPTSKPWAFGCVVEGDFVAVKWGLTFPVRQRLIVRRCDEQASVLHI